MLDSSFSLHLHSPPPFSFFSSLASICFKPKIVGLYINIRSNIWQKLAQQQQQQNEPHTQSTSQLNDMNSGFFCIKYTWIITPTPITVYETSSHCILSIDQRRNTKKSANHNSIYIYRGQTHKSWNDKTYKTNCTTFVWLFHCLWDSFLCCVFAAVWCLLFALCYFCFSSFHKGNALIILKFYSY